MCPGEAPARISRSTISCAMPPTIRSCPEWNVIHGPTMAAVAVPPRKP